MVDHAHRVAALVRRIGRRLSLSDEDLATLSRAALLHEIGKLTVPEALLHKPCALSREEQIFLERVPSEGYEVLHDHPFLAVADTYDTVTSARPFRDSMPPAEATLEMLRCAGTQFDPPVVRALLEVL